MGKVFTKALALISLIIAALPTVSAENYFIDGYHGGIYGHYPVAWKTRFITDEMKQHKDWFLGLEIEPETWDSVRTQTPADYAAMVALMRSGRVEYTNPTYAQPYCYNVLGESIIHQFQYGIAKLKSHFPDITFTTYSSEEPCFTSCLPMILKQLGFKYAVLKNPNTCWGGYTEAHGGAIVNWIGPDGTVMPTVPRYACEELEQNSTWQTTAWANSPAYFQACADAGIVNPAGMCYQDAGWRNGPWLGRNKRGTHYALWSDYISSLADEFGGPAYPDAEQWRVPQEIMRVNLMWGSSVLRRIARRVREAENRMIMAEKMTALSLLNGTAATTADHWTALDEGWRQLSLAQHHDSWIVPYNNLWHFGTWADAIEGWTAYACNAAGALSANVAMATAAATAAPTAITVFNTMSVARTEYVSLELDNNYNGPRKLTLTDSSGRKTDATVVAMAPTPNYDNPLDRSNNIKVIYRLFFMASVPPMGFTTYSVVASDSEPFLMTSDTDNDLDLKWSPSAPGGAEAATQIVTIGNDKLTMSFDLAAGGVVSSLKLNDKPSREFAANGQMRFGEMRGFFYNDSVFHSSTETPATVVEHINLPQLQRLTLAGEIAGTPFTQTVTLRQGDEKIDYHIHIDWSKNIGIGEYREKNWNHDRRAYTDDRYKLHMVFPTAFNGDRLLKNAPFDVCESTEENTFFGKWSEIKHNIVLNWVATETADASTALGLISDHTTSYTWGKDYPLGLVLQYSGQGLWGRDYFIDGPLDVHFAIVPACNANLTALMEGESDRFSEPLEAFATTNTTATAKSLLEVSDSGYRISDAQWRDGVLTVRLYNASGATEAATVKLNIAADKVTETNLLGNAVAAVNIARKADTTTWDCSMPVHAIRTFQVVTSAN